MDFFVCDPGQKRFVSEFIDRTRLSSTLRKLRNISILFYYFCSSSTVVLINFPSIRSLEEEPRPFRLLLLLLHVRDTCSSSSFRRSVLVHDARLPALIPSVRVAVLRVHRLRVLVQDLVVNQENEGAKVQVGPVSAIVASRRHAQSLGPLFSLGQVEVDDGSAPENAFGLSLIHI